MSIRADRAPWLLLVAAILGCATSREPPRPDWKDPAVATALAQRAVLACEERGQPKGPPERPFHTDVCSSWPNGSWSDCCVEHDIVYWCGGSRAERREADRQLRACVAERVVGYRGRMLGRLMEAGAFAGGAPWLPTPWRWGYGHPFFSGCRAQESAAEGMRSTTPRRGPRGSAPRRR